MIDKILWIIFYILTAFLIISYIFAERKVTDILNSLADKVSNKIILKKDVKHDVIIGLNILAILSMLGIFIFL